MRAHILNANGLEWVNNTHGTMMNSLRRTKGILIDH